MTDYLVNMNSRKQQMENEIEVKINGQLIDPQLEYDRIRNHYLFKGYSKRIGKDLSIINFGYYWLMADHI